MSICIPGKYGNERVCESEETLSSIFKYDEGRPNIELHYIELKRMDSYSR